MEPLGTKSNPSPRLLDPKLPKTLLGGSGDLLSSYYRVISTITPIRAPFRVLISALQISEFRNSSQPAFQCFDFRVFRSMQSMSFLMACLCRIMGSAGRGQAYQGFRVGVAGFILKEC